KRPDCSKILEELKHIEQTYDESHRLNKNSILDDERQKKLKIDLVNYFNLNKGRNCVEHDLVPGTKTILSDCGHLNINKLKKSDPIIYFPAPIEQSTNPWAILNNMNLFKNSDDENGLSHLCDDVKIHIPIATVQYRGSVAEQFSRDVENVLDLSDNIEKKERLNKVFNEWGNFVITEVVIGGAITIKNWSEIDYVEQSRLLTYIQWGIDYAKGGGSKIFSETPLNVLPRFEISKNIKTIGELYEWLKDLYNYHYAEIISYEDIRPSYELLPHDLVERILEFFLPQPVVEPIVRIIPQMLTQCGRQKLLGWIKNRKPRLLYMRDWIHDLSLEYAVLLQRSKLGNGDRAAFKYPKDPIITPIDNITILLYQPETQQLAYLFDNGLKEEEELNFSEIPFIDNQTLEYFQGLENNPSRTVFCQIIFSAIKISFKSIIKPSEQFSNAVDDALRSNDPYSNLCELFNNTYGLLVPQTIILGRKLTRTYDSCNIPPNTIKKQDPDFENFNAQAIKILTDLDNKYQDLDTTFFVDDNKPIRRDEIEEWHEIQSNNYNNWKVIYYDDWISTYGILATSQQNEIESILSDKYRIVFNGKETLPRDNQTTVTIKFPGPLFDENCQIYGCLVKKDARGNWEKIPDVMIRFDNVNRYRYYQHNLRKIKATYGRLDINGDQSSTYFKSKEISKGNVLVTSFVSSTLKETTFYKTNVTSWTSTKVDLNIQKVQEDNFKDNLINNSEKLTLQWCIINTNEINLTDDEDQESYPWSVFGTIFEDKPQCRKIPEVNNAVNKSKHTKDSEIFCFPKKKKNSGSLEAIY
ncbi:14850_t:CDS:2, partial [Racocetra persica]